jgi:[CysO sulfur-carrier protein]-S-L-cysteine hydrolase
MRLTREQRDALVEHARAEHPNECCGVVAVRDGTAVAVHQLENTAASPFRFEVDGMALHHLMTAIEDAGDQLGGIYHSHTRSEPYPSQTDVNFAAHWPGVEWLIVGTAGDGAPTLRSYLIDGGQVREAALEAADD